MWRDGGERVLVDMGGGVWWGGQATLKRLCYIRFTFLSQLIDSVGLESQKGAFSVPARQLGQDVFVRGGIRECVS